MSNDAELLSRLELFHGAATNHLARIYARIDLTGAFHAPYEGLSLSGFVRGPECEYSQTLPATIQLTSAGPGETLLAQAALPDPCFWTPDVPSRYRVHVELRRDGQVLETADREFAMRSFGPRGKSMFLDGRRWVPRGVQHVDLRPDDLAAWREARSVLVIEHPSDELCRAATRHGIVVFARVRGSRIEMLSELRRLARFGAVAAALLDAPDVEVGSIRQTAPNLVLLQTCAATVMRFEPQSWADGVVAEVDDPSHFAARFRECSLPVIAQRKVDSGLSLDLSRAACDLLQRDLAPFGDFAGFVV